MSSSTGWAGVPLTDRRAERRSQLVEHAFDLFGTGGESALSVRSVCRACGYNTRYFYESFASIDELLGAVYDRTADELATVVATATTDTAGSVRTRTAAGIRAVLAFGSSDPRRGRVLFTEARANPTLIDRRAQTQEVLRALTTAEAELRESNSLTTQIGAALFTGAMVELAHQWLTGALGTDLDAVVDRTVALLIR